MTGGEKTKTISRLLITYRRFSTLPVFIKDCVALHFVGHRDPGALNGSYSYGRTTRPILDGVSAPYPKVTEKIAPPPRVNRHRAPPPCCTRLLAEAGLAWLLASQDLKSQYTRHGCSACLNVPEVTIELRSRQRAAAPLPPWSLRARTGNRNR